MALSQADIDHISAVTNARGVQFAQPGLGPDPYGFVSTDMAGGNRLEITVKRQRTGNTFADAESAKDGPTDAVINAILTAIERKLQLKPAG